MKYIVDTDDFEPLFKVDSIGVFGIGKSLSDSDEDHSWSRIKSVEEFEELNSDYINEHYGELQDEAYERGHEIGYQKGFEDGKAQREHDDKIEVGDEVIYNGTTKCLVVRPETVERYAVLIDSNGNHHHADHSECKKTGRHFDIKSILEAMKHD